jgi:hypothetical protein
LNQKKRDTAPSPLVHGHRHGHGHLHGQHNKKRGEWITATINGQVVSWENTWYGGPATQAAAAPVAAAPTKAASNHASKPKPKPKVEKKPLKSNAKPVVEKPKKASGSKTNAYPTPGGRWKRTSYYNSQRRVADNVMFMGNYGGEGSGVFD